MIQNSENPIASRNLRKVNKEGKIKKKEEKIPVEIKKYKINELDALRKKFAKIDVELSVEEEKSSGRIIMVNLNTMLFEAVRQNLLEYLNVHPSMVSVFQAKSAKAITDEGSEADVEYHLDVKFKIKEEEYEVKLKLYTTNCRILVQFAGPKECKH